MRFRSLERLHFCYHFFIRTIWDTAQNSLIGWSPVCVARLLLVIHLFLCSSLLCPQVVESPLFYRGPPQWRVTYFSEAFPQFDFLGGPDLNQHPLRAFPMFRRRYIDIYRRWDSMNISEIRARYGSSHNQFTTLTGGLATRVSALAGQSLRF